ncbi:PEP-CTERM sorting domain-containing protein [Spirulina major CS-329]|uniref:PEP-CTERM sorting domain-containing protein n=1 Tax=Spirulina TaxID=1154 RepID=UPI00232D1206|nr:MULTISPECIES: PEP-CTERM sorting domain-containing protein [Spirulina]MDB9493521.1 PEP-CTERM sorting domain-containing protein [Spirulina subsalsa CS-330]MDB9501504.1 PEP-CTERM sorting domain-containing protein [Spirulina major CS-329]
MLMSRISPLIGFAAITGMTLGSATAAHAFTVFFGEDINPNPTNTTKTFNNIVNSRAAETEFLSNLSQFATEDFESHAIHTQPTNGGMDINFGSLGTATLSGGGDKSMIKSVDQSLLKTAGTSKDIKDSIKREVEKGRNASSGSQFWLTNAVQNYTISFTQAVGALGFYAYDLGDYEATTYLDLYRGGEFISSLAIENKNGSNGSTNGSAFYFGFMADNASQNFDRVEFRMNQIQGDEFAFDDFTVGKGVPEPMSMAAGLLGAGFFGMARRRKQQKS